MKSALKNKKKIETIFDKGFVVKAKGLLLKGYDFNDDETKFGVSVSKKSFPAAVKRNLIKRRVRHQAKDLDFVNSMPGSIGLEAALKFFKINFH